MEIVDGFVGSIAVAIPWSALINDSTALEIHNLELTIQPKKRADSAGKKKLIFALSYQINARAPPAGIKLDRNR